MSPIDYLTNEMTDASDEEEWTLPDLLRDLESAVTSLGSAIDAFRPRSFHFPGDLSLFGFLVGAYENGAAVLHLVRSANLPMAAFPNARACFEAAQDALLLVTEVDYDRAGSRVRVFERLEQVDIHDEMQVAFAGGDAPATSYAEARSVVAKDAGNWDREHPGRGTVLLEAFDYFRPKFEAARNGKSKHPGHWSERSRRGIARELEHRLGEAGFANRLIATYAQLSRYSHPRLRSESWDKTKGRASRRPYVRAERNGRIAVGVAELSTRLAIMAHERLPG